MMLHELVAASQAVAQTAARLEKIDRLADLLRRAAPAESQLAVAYLSGELPQGRIGLGPAALREAWPAAAASAPGLALQRVDEAFGRIAVTTGPGSTRERVRLLRELLEQATGAEQDFLARLLFGELRQGAQHGVMLEAVARAAGVSPADVRRAYLIAGDVGAVASAAFAGGEAALRAFGVRLFRPLQPMLAATAANVDDVLSRLGSAAFEYKVDGARVQIHKGGGDVRVFSRRLNDVTASVPELVELARGLAADEVVLEGEAIVLGRDGRPVAFQETMRRFGRRLDVARARVELPLQCFLFDCLYLDGESLIDRPAADRFGALAELAAAERLVPRVVTVDPAEAAAFLERATRTGHEGVVAKDLAATYDAGRRGRSWLKLKPSHTLDLVVLAAEWGHGRRRGWLSNLHLGARDTATNAFVMLGKTFKGMTDEMLNWQTRELQRLEIARDEHTVYVRPELVVEVAFDGVQTSPRYPGGVALRFARVKRYRPDKAPEQADTIERVRQIHAGT
jgi:DNA ligase 1